MVLLKATKTNASNFRSNIDVQATKDIKSVTKYRSINQRLLSAGGYSYGNQQAYSIFHQLLYSIPFVPKEYEGYPTSAYRGATSAANPIYGSANSGFQESRRVRIESSANVEYTAPFLKGLKANMFISWDWQDLASKHLLMHILSMPMILPPKATAMYKVQICWQMVTYIRVTKNHNK